MTWRQLVYAYLQIPCGTQSFQIFCGRQSFTNTLWHAVISNSLWHTVISNFLWHAVISNFHWHTVISNSLWHTVISDFVWDTVINKFPEAHGHFKLRIDHFSLFPKRCFYFQSGCQDGLSCSKCGSFSKCVFIFKM